MGEVVARVVDHFGWRGRVGCGMPGPIKNGRVMTANNIDAAWLGTKAAEVFARACGRPVQVINDADAAGIAEMNFGAGRKKKGVVLVLTLGTGIGSALFHDSILVPNMELGQIEVKGKNAEKIAAARIRKEKGLSWKKWAKRVALYVETVEQLVWPDLIIIGGGVSKRAEKFIHHITVRAKVMPARLRNEAGIIGAALAARTRSR